MSRFKPYVILDVLVTLPVFIWAVWHDSFRSINGGLDWPDLIAVSCILVVILPSLTCLLGWSLGQIPAVALILFYVLILVMLWFRILSGWHELHHITLIRVGAFLLIAKIWCCQCHNSRCLTR